MHLSVLRVRCALAVGGFLMVPHVRGGAVVVGAASDMLRGTTSRADHKQAWCQQTFNSKHSAAPTRESVTTPTQDAA
ncbi:hypothetical protein MyNCGM683_08810 [Achromobacter xylosoxidans]